MSGPTRLDSLAERVLALLPDARVSKTPHVIAIETGGEEGIVVLVTADGLEVRLPTVEWPGPHTPVPSSCFWKRIHVEHETDDAIMALLAGGRAARLAEFALCDHCGQPTPPEHAHEINGRWVCHGCAEEHEGIVH